MSEHVDALNAERLVEARAQLDPEGMMSDEEVLEVLDRHHPGGAAGFNDQPTDLAKMAARIGVDHRSSDDTSSLSKQIGVWGS